MEADDRQILLVFTLVTIYCIETADLDVWQRLYVVIITEKLTICLAENILKFPSR